MRAYASSFPDRTCSMIARSLVSTMLSVSTSRASLFVTHLITAHEAVVDHVLEPPRPTGMAVDPLPSPQRPSPTGIEPGEAAALRAIAATSAAAQRRAKTSLQHRGLAHRINPPFGHVRKV